MSEKEFNKDNITYEDIPDVELLDKYINEGLRLGVKRKRNNKIKMNINILVVFTLMLFTLCVRTSPTFAAYMTRIPGIESIVKLINYDKGLKSAAENNFIKSVNSSVEQDDIVVTIDSIMIDNSKGIIFYSIENKGAYRYIDLDNVKFADENGNPVRAAFSWGSFADEEASKNKKQSNKIEINFQDDASIPDKLCMSVKLREADNYNDMHRENAKALDAVWNFEIPVDKQSFKNMTKNYVLNQEIIVEGQKIVFKAVTITPTLIAVDVEYDKNNSMKIFGFDDIALIDEKGEKWATIGNGMSGTRKDTEHETLYFQSNYFTNPKELFIQGSSIRALDKSKLTVEVDLVNNKLLKVPDDRLSLHSATADDMSLLHSSTNTSDSALLQFNLRVDKELDQRIAYSVFDYEIKDSAGIVFHNNGSGVSMNDSDTQRIYQIFNSYSQLKSPIYFTLSNYPTRIKGNFKVKIK